MVIMVNDGGYCLTIEVFLKCGIPKTIGFSKNNLIWDDLGLPPFSETSI